jgi:hypothetical protein
MALEKFRNKLLRHFYSYQNIIKMIKSEENGVKHNTQRRLEIHTFCTKVCEKETIWKTLE